jgi:hypothetical protein
MDDVLDRAKKWVAAGHSTNVLIPDLISEIERLRAQIEDACKVFDHYDLPEHAFHYRRRLGVKNVDGQLTPDEQYSPGD